MMILKKDWAARLELAYTSTRPHGKECKIKRCPCQDYTLAQRIKAIDAMIKTGGAVYEQET